ncbi:MAG: Gfo/Idh/MocA family oxidoreductase [Caldilineaceae bacterium]
MTPRAQAYAQEWDIPRVHGSYEALLADPDVDVIYNPLPNTMHAEWTIKAAAAGKHVLCEKPVVTTLDDLDRVEAAAAQYGVTVFEAFMYLHHPQMRRLQELIAAGALGEVQMVNGWFHFYLPPERSSNIRLNRELGGGSLWDVGVYPNSAAIVVTGGKAPVAIERSSASAKAAWTCSCMRNSSLPRARWPRYRPACASPAAAA